jgi:hypothetical protein
MQLMIATLMIPKSTVFALRANALELEEDMAALSFMCPALAAFRFYLNSAIMAACSLPPAHGPPRHNVCCKTQPFIFLLYLLNAFRIDSGLRHAPSSSMSTVGA